MGKPSFDLPTPAQLKRARKGKAWNRGYSSSVCTSEASLLTYGAPCLYPVSVYHLAPGWPRAPHKRSRPDRDRVIFLSLMLYFMSLLIHILFHCMVLLLKVSYLTPQAIYILPSLPPNSVCACCKLSVYCVHEPSDGTFN